MSRLSKLLLLLSQGRTVPEIGADLGMRDEAVEAMIDDLVRGGYLLEVECGGCRFCTSGCSRSTGKRMFALTPQGECLRRGV